MLPSRAQSSSGEAIRSPFDGRVVAHVTELEPAGVDAVAARALAAFAEMRVLSSYRRAEILSGIAAGIRAEHARFSTLLAIESGKPLVLARAEIDRAIQTFTLGAEESKRLGGEILPIDITKPSEAFEGSWRRFPAGPVLGISPFNFALNLVAHKVAPALAVGASIVLKPAPQTPISALLLEDIARAAGAPNDALQVVPATVEASEALVKDPRFAVLSFTGSDRVGFHLKSICGKKRTLLELGGNAAAIVHEDAGDLDAIAKELAGAAFGYAGQVCIKTQRIFVHASIAARFTSAFVAATRALTTARDEKDEHAVMGPMIDEKAAIRVETWIDEAKRAGVTSLLEGPRAGNYLPAAILSLDPKSDGRGLRVVEEEAFGPVVVLQTYASWTDAIARVNASRFGLQCAIYTDSLARVREAYDALDVGGVIVNAPTTVRVDAMPYGGNKDSGLGREGLRFAMSEMTDPKMLVMRRTVR